MKATLRRNGRKMITFRIPFHLDWDRFVLTLARYMSVYGEWEGKRTDLEKLVRYELFELGCGAYCHLDDVTEEMGERAERIIDELMPELQR